MDHTISNTTKVVLSNVLATGLSLLLLYNIGTQPSADCSVHLKTPNEEKHEKPILLVWFWPLGVKFNFEDCKTYFNIDSCLLTDDRSLYSVADSVIFYHKTIAWDLSNLPKGPRPAFQKWIWYNVESPTNTGRKRGLDDLFNLTLTYRRDLDIATRFDLNIVRTQEQFVLPKKDKFVCWISTNNIPETGASTRLKYYNELRKHIHVNVYGQAVPESIFLRYEEYYSTIASCKFYLAFENSIHLDYFTEKLNGPMVSGTVPIVLGPSRENYEQFVPADSFIHVNDFPNPKAMADYLNQLNQNNDLYMRYFSWRKYFKAKPHLLTLQNEFTQPICEACHHISRDNTFNIVHDLFWWYNGRVEGHQAG